MGRLLHCLQRIYFKVYYNLFFYWNFNELLGLEHDFLTIFISF
jgi:hypothetical protein